MAVDVGFGAEHLILGRLALGDLIDPPVAFLLLATVRFYIRFHSRRSLERIMARFVKWIQKTVENIVDPDRENRIKWLVTLLQNGLHSQRRSFSLSAILQGHDYAESELEIAKQRVYRTTLERAWTDGKLTESKQEVIQWVATSLQIPNHQAVAINVDCARRCFAVALARAMEDGVLDEQEVAQLREIASSVGSALPHFARSYFRSEGESFLRGIFLACVADGHISQSDWNYLLATTQTLGLQHDEMLSAIQPQARQFVEHVLADAKSDGRLTEHEEAILQWLVNNLGLPNDFRRYILGEVSALRTWTEIHAGRLPSLSPPRGIETRAGEIVHFHGDAVWEQIRVLKSGPRSDRHHGFITLTDNRLMFSSPTRSQSLGYRRIVSHRGGPNRIEIQVEGKPASTFWLDGQSPIPYAIFQMAVAMANQTKVAAASYLTRHIPRDVRQRVWQRYGGRCAECGADDYLEFDHIVPVAKGGSNSDANVQLLCRRCNLKKSDHI